MAAAAAAVAVEESAPALAAILAMDTAAGISIETIPTDRQGEGEGGLRGVRKEEISICAEQWKHWRCC